MAVHTSSPVRSPSRKDSHAPQVAAARGSDFHSPSRKIAAHRSLPGCPPPHHPPQRFRPDSPPRDALRSSPPTSPLVAEEAGTHASSSCGSPPHPAPVELLRLAPTSRPAVASRRRRWRWRGSRSPAPVVHPLRQPLQLHRSRAQRLRAVAPHVRHHLVIDVAHHALQILFHPRPSLTQLLFPTSPCTLSCHSHTSPRLIIPMRGGSWQRPPPCKARAVPGW